MIEEFDKPYKIYTADGATKSWEYPYPYTDKDTIALYVKHDGVLTQINAQNYTVTQVEESSVVKTYVNYPLGQDDDPVPVGDSILLWRTTDITQLEDSTDTNFKSNDIERMVDKLTMIAQELSDDYDRTVHFQPTDSYNSDANYYIEAINDAKDTAVEKAGEASTSATNAAASATKAQKWAEGSDADVAPLGGTHSAKGWANIAQTAAESEAVQTVAGNIEDIQTVATNISDVQTVSGISAAVSAVAGNETNINIVADEDNLADVGTVATNISSVNNVASISSDVTTVSGLSSEVTAVSGNATDISSVADNISNVNAVAANETNINAVNSNKTNIDAVAGNATNINAVAGNATNINAVNANKTNIDAVAGIDQAVTTVATNVQDINDVANALTDIGAVADDLTNIDAVADDLTNIDLVAGSLSDIQDKQNKTLATPITVDGTTQTTVEGALGAINTFAAGKQAAFTVINGGDSTNA